jgi:hypothetical protein
VAPRSEAEKRRASVVDLPGDRRSVIATYRYGRELRTTTAQDVPAVHAKARRLWGEPDALESMSTPRSVYHDVTGETRRRAGASATWGDFGSKSWGGG